MSTFKKENKPEFFFLSVSFPYLNQENQDWVPKFSNLYTREPKQSTHKTKKYTWEVVLRL